MAIQVSSISCRKGLEKETGKDECAGMDMKIFMMCWKVSDTLVFSWESLY